MEAGISAAPLDPDSLVPPAEGARWDLPPGRAPGAMHRLDTTTLIAFTVFFGLICPVGVVLVSKLFYQDEGDASVGVLELILFAAIGPFIAVLYALAVRVRRLGPATARHLQLAVGPPALAPGGEVVARLRLLDPRRVGERLEIGLLCVATRAAFGEHEPDVVRHVLHEEWRDADRRDPDQLFRFRIPGDAVVSLEDEASVGWRVSTREPRKGLRRRSRNVPFWVTRYPGSLSRGPCSGEPRARPLA